MSNSVRTLNLFFSNNLFLGSFKNIKKMPKLNLPECCFIGRSNVGKSSIINALTKSKDLTKISKTPGRTQTANFFQINNLINIVDLPGYGYAKVSKNIRKELIVLQKNYISNRENLNIVFVLIDCKVGIKNLDLDMLDLINFSNKKFSVVLTKIDKCADNFVNKQLNSIHSLMNNYRKNFNKIIASSSKKNLGILELQKDIFKLSKYNEI